MARADAIGAGDSGGEEGYACWIAGGAFAIGVHAALLLYLNQSPPPHQFDSAGAIEVDMAPAPAGAQASAEQAAEAQPEELEEITPDEMTPPEEMGTAETPPDIQTAVAIPPEQTVTAREVTVEPKPTPKPKPIVKREEPNPIVRERPKPNPEARRGETVQQARQGATTPSAASAGRQGATSGDPNASRAAAAAYGGRVRSAINATKSCVAGVNDRAVVRFSVNRAGRVTSVSASGSGPFVAAASALVRRAVIPPMPTEMTGSSASYSLSIWLKQC